MIPGDPAPIVAAAGTVLVATMWGQSADPIFTLSTRYWEYPCKADLGFQVFISQGAITQKAQRQERQEGVLGSLCQVRCQRFILLILTPVLGEEDPFHDICRQLRIREVN